MPYDYTTVTPDSVRAAVDRLIEDGDAIIASVETAEERTWESTMAPLDTIGAMATRAYGAGPFMARAHPDEPVRSAAQEAEQRLGTWQSELVFRRGLYEAVEAYAATDEAQALEGERARLLEFARRDFRRAGHALDEATRESVRQKQLRLVELGITFGRNIDEYSGGLDLTSDQLTGLPDEFVAGLPDGDRPESKRVSLDYPDYFPFMDLADDRDARRRLQFEFYNKAVEENRPILEEAVRLRKEIAASFGMASWAHYAMEEKMAKTPETVDAFLSDIVPGLTRLAAAELEDLGSELGDGTVQPWDHRYLHEKIKRERHGVDQTEVAGYFPLDEVLAGMFSITSEVFGLDYQRRTDVPTWHDDVQVWDVNDASSGDHLATFYMDLFPREGKFGHAAAFPLEASHATAKGYVTPLTAILCNFTKPTGSTPSLLRHDEVVTLFHEFGHVLHNSLGHTELARFSGFNTEWDFVEAPSQIMEHWCWEPEALRRFARHHETGEPIPEELVERLVAARDLHQGLSWVRQVSFGRLDLSFHDDAETKDLDAINRETSELTGLPFHEDTFYPAGFGHLFGYDAGYYGYLWAKVFGDDMFSRFAEHGALSPEIGREYREKVLAPGGSMDAHDMLVEFLGREPNQEAFLANLGIA